MRKSMGKREMVKVESSTGGMVNVEIKGIGEVLRMLQTKKQQIADGTEVGILQIANLVQQELQESIIGNRAEVKSVDTGRFGNSIEVEKVEKYEFVIKPNNDTYPNGQTVKSVAKILEYGTTKLAPRYHFRNTVARNQEKAGEMMQDIIDRT